MTNTHKKLESVRAIAEWDNGSIFRAKVYARLLRAIINELGNEDIVLDIAEEHRRENGRYQGEINRDLAAQDARYREDPALLIADMDAMWHDTGADWGYTCKCVYAAAPAHKKHHLYSIRCTYAQAFLEEQEEKIGITWCCWDMGFTPGFHPLFCQYMPKHMLKGDALCHQVRALASSPSEQARLNGVEYTGWRSFDNHQIKEEEIADNQQIHRALFTDLTPADKYRADRTAFFDNLYNGDGYYDLVQVLAEALGEKVYAIAENVFDNNKIIYDPATLRTPFAIRRTDYNYMGENIYNIAVSEMQPEQISHMRRVYNNAAFLHGAALISDEDIAKLPGSVLVATNERGKVTGFSSANAVIFSEGRIHEPTRLALGCLSKKPIFLDFVNYS